MTLTLAVPAPQRLTADVERRPAKVEKWLTTLPLLNVAETGQKLYTTLSTYNRIPLDASLRLELLELYRSPIRHLDAELQKHYVGLPLPLPERHRTIAEQHREFHVELAYGYKHLVLSQAGAARPNTLKDALPLALPIQRAIRHLTEVLLTSHLSYSPVPPGTWKEIHLLYRHAERLALLTVAVDDPLNAHGKGSVADAYKRAVLLDLGDPYHLPSRMIAKIDQYLDSVAGLATLQLPSGKPEPNCQFLIDTESDQAGLMHTDDDVLESIERYRLLNTFELARTIHAQLTQLQSGGTPDAVGLAPDFFRRGGQDMLLRLINVWGLNPKRAFRRSERPNAKVDVAIGLDAIDYWLNGERRSTPSGESAGPMPPRPSSGTFGAHQEISGLSAAPGLTIWNIQDESAGGMSLCKVGTARGRVRVGDILATRSAGGSDWTISTVRWVKSANPSSVEIGIQRLAPTAKPVLVKAVSGDQEESDFLPGLLLPAIPALKEPETLVIPYSVFRPERVLYLDDGVATRRILAKHLFEAASGYERIEFKALT
jgi:cyclic-di-GMP-binding protein